MMKFMSVAVLAAVFGSANVDAQQAQQSKAGLDFEKATAGMSPEEKAAARYIVDLLAFEEQEEPDELEDSIAYHVAKSSSSAHNTVALPQTIQSPREYVQTLDKLDAALSKVSSATPSDSAKGDSCSLQEKKSMDMLSNIVTEFEGNKAPAQVANPTVERKRDKLRRKAVEWYTAARARCGKK